MYVRLHTHSHNSAFEVYFVLISGFLLAPAILPADSKGRKGRGTACPRFPWEIQV